MGSYLATETLCARFKHLLAFTKSTRSTYAKKYSHLQNLTLADSGASGDIDLLIGSGYSWNLVTGKVKTGKPDEPVTVEIVFGWILNGPVAKKLLILLPTLIFQNVTYYFLIRLRHISLTI